MRCSRRATLMLLASLMGLLPGTLFAQSDVTTVASEATSRGQFFGILGQVAKPGVYELPADRRTLNDLIEAAGGLTANASNNLRIVRRGRSGGQAFFQPRIRFELLPGDVFISDRRRTGIGAFGGAGSGAANRDSRDSTVFVTTPDRSGQGGTTTAGRESDSGTSNVVQLGVVGLIDRPVVIAMPADQATLQTVLTTLHQPREGARQITLLRDGSTSQTVPLTEAAKTVLTTGTVLVFDQKSAQTETLPKLPAPVRWQDRTLESTPPQSLTAASESAKPATTAESTTPLPETRSAEPTPLARGTVNRLIPPSQSLVSVPGSTSTVVDDTDKFEVADESETDAATSRGPSGKPGSEASVADSASTPPVVAAKPGLSGELLAAIILVGTLTCIGGLMLVEFLRGRSRSQAAAVSVMADKIESPSDSSWQMLPASAPTLAAPATNPVFQQPVAVTTRPVELVASANLLDDLVGNRLPVVTEQLALPNGVRIYGKPVERTDELQFRLDAAHPVPAPHISRSAAAQYTSSHSEHTVGVEDIPRRAT
ncbi:MAG: SLBB domain-containing protein, partial [Planctomycetales bacterium]|nr:SLBB domain-containing protein [Planctomycetales bacterium]